MIRPRLNLTESEFEEIKKLGDPSDLLRTFLTHTKDQVRGVWGRARTLAENNPAKDLLRAVYIKLGADILDVLDSMKEELSNYTLDQQISYACRHYNKDKYKGQDLKEILTKVKHTRLEDGGILFTEAIDWMEVCAVVKGKMQIQGPNKFCIWEN